MYWDIHNRTETNSNFHVNDCLSVVCFSWCVIRRISFIYNRMLQCYLCVYASSCSMLVVIIHYMKILVVHWLKQAMWHAIYSKNHIGLFTICHLICIHGLMDRILCSVYNIRSLKECPLNELQNGDSYLFFARYLYMLTPASPTVKIIVTALDIRLGNVENRRYRNDSSNPCTKPGKYD